MKIATRHATARSGFTLIELMVVLVLIGIMTAMIVGEMRGTYEDALLRSTSRKMISVINLTQSRAITSHAACRIRLDTRKNRYFIEASNDDKPGPSNGSNLQGNAIEEGSWEPHIQIEIRKPGETFE